MSQEIYVTNSSGNIIHLDKAVAEESPSFAKKKTRTVQHTAERRTVNTVTHMRRQTRRCGARDMQGRSPPRSAGARKYVGIEKARILCITLTTFATSRAAASVPAPLNSRPAPASASIWRQPGANHDWREPGTILAIVAPLTAVAHLSRSWEVVGKQQVSR